MRNKLLTLIVLLTRKSEYRNVLLLRANKYVRHIFEFLYFPQRTLYLNTPSNSIGGGFHIVHGFSTIINAEKIGNNCQVFQQVTIGNGKGGIPTIGNNVKIYAGAIIIAKIIIGDNCIWYCC